MFEQMMKKLNMKPTKTSKQTLLIVIVVLAAIIAIVAVIALTISAVTDFIGQRNTPTVLVGADVDTRAYAAEGYALGQDEAQVAPRLVVVYVSGEVYNPGVFEFYEGARIVDAVTAAGGKTSYADPNAINLAARLVDDQHIIVFSLEDNMPPTAAASGGTGQAADGRININTATSEQLQTLSGIGPVMAGNIISHREARGGFATIEEIKNVSGIGERTFENLRDRITVD